MAFALIDSYMTPARIPVLPDAAATSAPAARDSASTASTATTSTPGAPNPTGANNLAIALVTDDDDDWDNGNDQVGNFNVSRVGLLHGRSWDEDCGDERAPAARELVSRRAEGRDAVDLRGPGRTGLDHARARRHGREVERDGLDRRQHVLRQRARRPAAVGLHRVHAPACTSVRTSTPSPTSRSGTGRSRCRRSASRPTRPISARCTSGRPASPAPITITNDGFVDATVSLASAPGGFAVGGSAGHVAARRHGGAQHDVHAVGDRDGRRQRVGSTSPARPAPARARSR